LGTRCWLGAHFAFFLKGARLDLLLPNVMHNPTEQRNESGQSKQTKDGWPRALSFAMANPAFRFEPFEGARVDGIVAARTLSLGECSERVWNCCGGPVDRFGNRHASLSFSPFSLATHHIPIDNLGK
jgi:hypothetical protein